MLRMPEYTQYPMQLTYLDDPRPTNPPPYPTKVHWVCCDTCDKWRIVPTKDYNRLLSTGDGSSCMDISDASSVATSSSASSSSSSSSSSSCPALPPPRSLCRPKSRRSRCRLVSMCCRLALHENWVMNGPPILQGCFFHPPAKHGVERFPARDSGAACLARRARAATLHRAPFRHTAGTAQGRARQ